MTTVDFGTYYNNNNNNDDNGDNNNNRYATRPVRFFIIARGELFTRSAPTFMRPTRS